MKTQLVIVALLIFSSVSTFAADGDLDTATFNSPSGSRTTNVTTGADVGEVILQQPDGKIVVVARCNSRFCVLRYNTNGSLDTTLGGDGIAETTILGFPTGGALQTDGKIVAVTGNIVVRFNADGSLDSTFDGDGQVTTSFGGSSAGFVAVFVLPDGKILGVGTRNQVVGPDLRDIIMARYNTDGSLDTTFDSDGILISNLTTPAATEEANDAVLHPDGRIIIAGWKADAVGFANFLVARYNPNGTLDTTFDSDGWVSTDVFPNSSDIAETVTLTPIGRIVVGGSGGSAEATPASPALLRYNPDGVLEPSFDGDGILLPNLGSGGGAFQDAVVQQDGKIVAQLLRGTSNSIVRLNYNGSFDTSFSGDGNVSLPGARKVALQSDGKIITTGTNPPTGANTSVFTARLLNTPGPFTAAQANIRGRIFAANGTPIRNAVVVLTGGSLAERVVSRSSTFGYYGFHEVDVGATYIVEVYAKGFSFAPRVITFNEELHDFDLVALEVDFQRMFPK